jgi:CO dehydrogenase maturation factor
MALKIAVSGKGGVGKTTVAAVLASLYARDGRKVIAVDADPASSLPAALGVPEEKRSSIVPLSCMLDVIEERTGARPGNAPSLYSLTPKVDDLVAKYAVRGRDGVEVLVLGPIKAPGSGCFCPESALLKALLRHLVLEDQHLVLIDMEAGLEHLGRCTSQSVDVMLVVVEPGRRSVDTASRIATMATELGVRNVFAVLNKTSSAHQEEEIRRLLDDTGLEILASIPYDPHLVDADLAGRPAMECGSPAVVDAIATLRESIDLRTRG